VERKQKSGGRDAAERMNTTMLRKAGETLARISKKGCQGERGEDRKLRRQLT
jgi:hypothetical protein